MRIPRTYFRILFFMSCSRVAHNFNTLCTSVFNMKSLIFTSLPPEICHKVTKTSQCHDTTQGHDDLTMSDTGSQKPHNVTTQHKVMMTSQCQTQGHKNLTMSRHNTRSRQPHNVRHKVTKISQCHDTTQGHDNLTMSPLNVMTTSQCHDNLTMS